MQLFLSWDPYILAGPFRIGVRGWMVGGSVSFTLEDLLYLIPMDRWHGFQKGLPWLSCPFQLGTGRRWAFGRKQCLEDQTVSIEQAEAETALAASSKTHHLPAAYPLVCPEKSANSRFHQTWQTFTFGKNSDKIFFSKIPKSMFHSLLILFMYWRRKLIDSFKLRTPGLESTWYFPITSWAPGLPNFWTFSSQDPSLDLLVL